MASFNLHFLNLIENIDDYFNECYETGIFNLFNSHDDILSHWNTLIVNLNQSSKYIEMHKHVQPLENRKHFYTFW